MKKNIKLITCFIFVLLLCGCGAKNVITDRKFQNKLTNMGYTTSDVTSEIKDDNITKIIVGNNGRVQIDFYEFKTEALAKKAYKNNKKSFINLSDKKYSEKNKETYDLFSQELTDKYNYLIRVKNTLIYSSVNIEYKKDLQKTLKGLNY